jgi:hypothetical protein
MTNDLHLVYVPSTLPRRSCTAESPMQEADKGKYQWSHADALDVAPFFNLMVYKCPYCGTKFHAPKRTP